MGHFRKCQQVKFATTGCLSKVASPKYKIPLKLAQNFSKCLRQKKWQGTAKIATKVKKCRETAGNCKKKTRSGKKMAKKTVFLAEDLPYTTSDASGEPLLEVTSDLLGPTA